MQNCTLSNVPLNKLNVSIIQNTKLSKIGLHTVQDLLLHIPLCYEDRTNISKIKDLIPGKFAIIKGKLLSYNVITFNCRKMMICYINDGSGILTMRFFNFNLAIKKKLATDNYLLIYGKTEYGKYGIEMIHPKFYVQRNDSEANKFQNVLTPIYLTVKGLKQVTWHKMIDQALDMLYCYGINELLPPEIANSMMSLSDALRTLHRPLSSQVTLLNNREHPAQKRLIFEELLAYNLNMLALRVNVQRFYVQPLTICNDLKDKLLASLPFKPTDAQKRVLAEIEHDMTLNVPMMRLVQGDVGSGKTLVAALAALNVIAHGKQVAIMVPTELLAKQHANNFRNWFSPLGIRVGCLVGKQKSKARFIQYDAISNGNIQLVIGTHAIFQDHVRFHKLVLVIIDEQHRFGVHQRLSLWKKGIQQGYNPHQLIMTATPIPRTLAMAIYADLDTSIIDELPSNRTPVTTIVIPNTRRDDIINRVRYACIKDGRQVYWVCTIIEKSKLLEVRAAESICKELKIALPELNIGLVHGRMKLTEKQEIMQWFKQGSLHLLVATTVIEVGLDVPNASLMIIENAERLGLAQLHQLRGRIGRSSVKSHCILLYQSPLSKIAKERLQVIRNNNDGFVISQKDLEIRGPGEFLGTRQTGRKIEFKVADLLRDQALFTKAKHTANYIHKYYPEQATALINRWMIKKSDKRTKHSPVNI